jgi:hypothetical protein
MNLRSIVDTLPCAAEVRRRDRDGGWTRPAGLRLLDGRAVLPDEVATKVSAY